MNSYFKGVFYGVVTSATFGLIPLFSIPLLDNGLSIDSILFYRFLIASIVLGLMMGIKKESFKIAKADILPLIILGVLYTSSALFLLMGYTYMDAGVATTLHFTYPIFVTLFMLIFFREKPAFTTIVAIILAILGVASLSITDGKISISIFGMIVVIASSVVYALYIVAVNRSRLQKLSGTKLTFYVFSTSALLFFLKALTSEAIPSGSYLLGGLQTLPSIYAFASIILLAILPTVVSNIALVRAISYVGGTMTSILGAMEPVTAVFIGVLVFGEVLTFDIVMGILLILIAVSLIILSKPIQHRFKQFPFFKSKTKRVE